MKSKSTKIFLFIFTIITFLLNNGFAGDINPDRPKSVPKEALWKKHSLIWVIGSFDSGDKKIWYNTGILMYEEKIIKSDLKICLRYHKNGKINETGLSQYFKDKYYDNDGNLIGWIEIGKWKEYDKEGNLIHEWCLTPNPNRGGEEPQKCGEEKYYNKDGTVKNKIQNKYQCQYGCEELEYKDSTK